jgi:predicted GTPase
MATSNHRIGRLAEHRNVTLDIYKRLLDTRKKEGKRVPTSVARTHTNLNENRFLLAVIGKVNAGKSTFINALLGHDLLPTDSLQATAAIVEICHRELPLLRITYANNETKECPATLESGSLEELARQAREVAAVSHDNRDLPIAQLDDFIIAHYDRTTHRAEWDDELLNHWINTELPAVLKQPPGEWQARSKRYLEERRSGGKVVKSIEIGFPSKFEFDHFRLVDTPGIGARGGLAERTHGFLENADAVIYLHKDEPNEDSLHENLNQALPEKTKRSLLLVLTHKASRDDAENERFLKEAQRVCSEIPAERVFLVDSLTDRALQAYYDQHTWDEIAELRKRHAETRNDWRRITAAAFEDASGDRASFLDLLERQSNMRSLKNTVLRLAEESLALQIETLLENIKELYAEMEAEARAEADLLNVGLKDPQSFHAEMTRLTQEMKSFEAESKRRVKRISERFNPDNKNQAFASTLDWIIREKEEEVNGRGFDEGEPVSTAENFMRKLAQDAEDSLSELADGFLKDLKNTFSEMELDLQKEFGITIPKIALTEIIPDLKEDATETKEIDVEKPGFFNGVWRFLRVPWGWGKEQVRALNANSYYGKLRNQFCEELKEMKLNIASQVRDAVSRACTAYNRQTENKLNQRRERIRELEQDHQSNEALRAKFDQISGKAEAARRDILECEKIKGDL